MKKYREKIYEEILYLKLNPFWEDKDLFLLNWLHNLAETNNITRATYDAWRGQFVEEAKDIAANLLYFTTVEKAFNKSGAKNVNRLKDFFC